MAVPTCSLAISSAATGLPAWQPSTYYCSVADDPNASYTASLITDHGNLWVPMGTGVSGLSGTSNPLPASPTPGDVVQDAQVRWTCVELMFTSNWGSTFAHVAGAFVSLGSSPTLTWASAGATSATLNGSAVAVSGTSSPTPAPSQVGILWTTSAEQYGLFLGAPTMSPSAIINSGLACAYGTYTLTATNSTGSSTSTVYFCLIFPPTLNEVDCFAPISSTVVSPQGGAGANTAVALDLPLWLPDTEYPIWSRVLDSNGYAQVALAPGHSGGSPPAWKGFRQVTTEITGLPWQNTGQRYPGFIIQRGFGPQWNGGSSSIEYAFEQACIPNGLTFPPWAANAGHNFGDVSIAGYHAYEGPLGQKLLQCVTAGASASSSSGVYGPIPPAVVGMAFAESAALPIRWIYLGLFQVQLCWEASTVVPAPDGYGTVAYGARGAGLMPQDYNVAPNVGTPRCATALSNINIPHFIDGTATATYDAQVAVQGTLGIPPYNHGLVDSGPCLYGPCTLNPLVSDYHWICIGLYSGYINSTCCGGYEVDMYGCWIKFSIPYALPQNLATGPECAPGVPTFLGFTTHDVDITYDAGNGDGPILYRGSTGMANTAKQANSDLGVDGLEVTAFLESDAITEEDIRAGVYDNAEVTLRLVNWADLSQGHVTLMRGTVGDLKMRNGLFTAELRGLSQALTAAVGATYGEICRADLGSNSANSTSHWLCNVDLDLYRQPGSVASVVDDRTIVPAVGLLQVGFASPAVAAPAGWFNDGIITFSDGAAECVSAEIKSWDGTTLILFRSLPALPAAGDTFTIEPGCNKGSDCRAKFQNVVNQQAEPFIPGMDQLLDYGSG